MSIPEKNDVLRFSVYSNKAEEGLIEISWSQNLRTRSARYFVVKAKNTSKRNSEVLLYIQDRFYKDEGSGDFVGKIPGTEKDNGEWVASITEHFQYGQKNAQGDLRWLALHDKGNKPYQHRFMVTTIQGNLAGWAKDLAKNFGASEIVNAVHSLGSNSVGDYLKNF